jgi:uncharacterized membrane protein
MILRSPWWLLALPVVVALIVVAARRGRRAVPARQHRWAVAARLGMVVLLVAALAQPVWARPVDTHATLFLVDRSASIGQAAIEDQEAYIAEALGEARPEDRSGVMVFGAEARVDTPLAAGRQPTSVRTEVDDSATDVATALRAAATLLPTEGSRRIVVLSDLVPTSGDAGTVADELAAEGIAVDVVAVGGDRSADAVLDGVEAPATVRRGDQVPVTVSVRSTEAGAAELVVDAGGDQQRLPVQLEPGSNEIEVQVPAAQTGFMTIGAEIITGFDTRSENDRAVGLTRVLGAARVAVVEGRAGEGAELADALEAGNLAVDVLGGIPSAETLLRYDAAVLVNVAAPTAEVAETLRGFVEDLGRGLVVIGGDQAYGLGDYQDSPLEDLLPVQSNPDDLIRRQPLTEVLVIDTSGSMAACHCRDETFVEGGVNKTDISRAGAQLAIEALSTEDRVGVLAVSSGTRWVLPVGPRPDQPEVEAALATLSPQGDTELANGLMAALEELRDAPAGLRHIVLFTDGWDPNEAGLLPVARQIADAGITLSVLGTGEGVGNTLERISEVGGGRFYPGTDLEAVPEVFVEETLTVARSLASEGEFLPSLAAPSPVTDGLTRAPAVFGYVLTKAKTTASTALEIGPADPLLSTWQRGLGRVTAWTSDATSRWSSAWVEWDGYVSFWGDVLRQVLPAGLDTPPVVTATGGRLHVSFEAGDVPLDAAGTARVRLPDGETALLALRRTDATTFAGSFPLQGPGAYWVSVAVESADGGRVVGSSGAVSSYDEEFAFREPDPGLATAVAEATGGRVGPAPSEAFDRAPAGGRAQVDTWPWLAAAALVLFGLDVALRRLVLTADRPTPTGTAATSGSGPPPPPPPPEPAGAEPAVPEKATVDRLLRRRRR